MTPDAKLKKLQDLLKMIDESITREEFTASFENAVKLILDSLEKVNRKVDAKLSAALQELSAEVAQLKQSADDEFAGRRADLQAKIDQMFKEQSDNLNFLRDKVRGLKNGERGPRGLPGKDGSPDTGEQIVEKINNASATISKDSVDGLVELEKKVDTMPRGGVGGAKGIGLFVGGAKKKLTAQSLDFVAGSNVTISHSTASGVDQITIASTGGGGGGSGDVVGPASATDNAIARYDGTTGKLIQNSAATIADTTGNITAGTYNGNTIGAGSTSGTNTGDQTSIVGITGTKAEFDTAVTDGNFLYVGDITQYTDELAQDAVGGMVANSTFVNLTYNDATPSLTAALSATGTPSSSTFLRGDNTWATPAGGGGGITRSITTTSSSATMGSTASTDYVYFVAGAHTMTLPTAVSNTNRYTIKNNHSAAITVDTTSSQTIDGTTTIQIAPEDSVDIISNNTNWFVV